MALIKGLKAVKNKGSFKGGEWAFSNFRGEILTEFEQIYGDFAPVKKMDEAEAKRVEKTAKGMMQKILKSHVLQFKAACKCGEAESLVGC